jgi:hypothetical protein
VARDRSLACTSCFGVSDVCPTEAASQRLLRSALLKMDRLSILNSGLYLLGVDGALPQFDDDLMFAAVVYKRNEIFAQLDTVQSEAAFVSVLAVRLDCDVVERLPKAIVNLKRLPLGWHTRGDSEFVRFDVQAEQ